MKQVTGTRQGGSWPIAERDARALMVELKKDWLWTKRLLQEEEEMLGHSMRAVGEGTVVQDRHGGA